jgi:hypothetical protein
MLEYVRATQNTVENCPCHLLLPYYYQHAIAVGVLNAVRQHGKQIHDLREANVVQICTANETHVSKYKQIIDDTNAPTSVSSLFRKNHSGPYSSMPGFSQITISGLNERTALLRLAIF